MTNNGYIKLPRQFVDSALYRNVAVKVLLIHLIINASYLDGHDVLRGQHKTSLRSIAQETGLSLQKVRTALSILVAEHLVTQSSTHGGTIITICNYDRYQGSVTISEHNRQHSIQHIEQEEFPPTPPLKETQRTFEEWMEDGSNSQKNVMKYNFVAPSLQDVTDYVLANNLCIDASRFFEYYTQHQWLTAQGNPICDWKIKANEWSKKQINNDKKYENNLNNRPTRCSKREANEYAIRSLFDQ